MVKTNTQSEAKGPFFTLESLDLIKGCQKILVACNMSSSLHLKSPDKLIEPHLNIWDTFVLPQFRETLLGWHKAIK